ncbi:hypothetical protein TRFO_40217 [Tritrichomonas foetus]|uniref:Doublecortin domain-containing protein n=1 Tax=Tritrichomonas foetus TaxID=1144522 RepID=A0A1J4J1V5_9EUKA|nr:hypothetical protein TRFO_40217 [Tritrichomonas foetus]|eukprot:OHS93488.1 hypothetical protein TRFO_40217 [Tritrichomonas foetus]
MSDQDLAQEIGEQIEEEEEEEAIEENIKNKNSNPSSPTQRKPLHERSMRGKLIYIAKNAYPRDNFKRYKFTSLDKLLSESMTLVGLNEHAKKIYKEDGTVVKDETDILDGQKYLISCGEKYNYGFPSPGRKSSPIKKDVPPEEVEDKSPAKPDEPPKSKEQIKFEKKQQRFQKEVLSFQRILAVSPKTVEETLHHATSSVFQSLLENQRRRLPNYYQLQEIHDSTQQGRFISHLIDQKICPSSNDILAEVDDWTINFLKAASLDELKYVITGPRQSGKTTLLYTISSILFRKLQISEEASNYLFFPMNFEYQTLELSNHSNLLKLFISTAFDALEYCNFALLPYVQQLRKWFIMTVYGAQLQFPNGITQVGNVDVNALTALSKGLGTALKGQGQNGLQNFIQKVCEFPALFAKALGFTDVIFILDSFEYCDFFFTPNDEVFPESLKPVSLSQTLCESLMNNSSLYLISLQDEQHFMECFSCDDAALIDTEGLLRGITSPSEIIVRQPPLRLGIDDCLGCPGYISMFEKLCNMARAMQLNAAATSQYSLIRTQADLSRMKVVKQELVRLCHLLMYSGSELITKELLNTILAEEILVVTMNEKEEKENDDKEEEEKNQKENHESTENNEEDKASTATVEDSI